MNYEILVNECCLAHTRTLATRPIEIATLSNTRGVSGKPPKQLWPLNTLFMPTKTFVRMITHMYGSRVTIVLCYTASRQFENVIHF